MYKSHNRYTKCTKRVIQGHAAPPGGRRAGPSWPGHVNPCVRAAGRQHSVRAIVLEMHIARPERATTRFKASATPSLALLLNPLAWFLWTLDFAIWLLTFGWVKTLLYLARGPYSKECGGTVLRKCTLQSYGTYSDLARVSGGRGFGTA